MSQKANTGNVAKGYKVLKGAVYSDKSLFTAGQTVNLVAEEGVRLTKLGLVKVITSK